MLEAMACGVPVAAYPVTGPVDVVVNGKTGVLDNNLEKAIQEALKLDPATCRQYALDHSWHAASEAFESYLENNSVTKQEDCKITAS
jgi:glycosyltransferase involved in cell wall biosynthesis